MKENKKIKLSSLDKNEKIITDDVYDTVRDVEDILEDIVSFRNKKLHVAKKYHAVIDARDMLEAVLESEQDNMYEDWYDYVIDDITENDVEIVQKVLDDILGRSGDQNVSYNYGTEIEIDL